MSYLDLRHRTRVVLIPSIFLSNLTSRLQNDHVSARARSRNPREDQRGRDSGHEACKRIIEQLTTRDETPQARMATGGLTVTSPSGLGHLHLLPLLCEFEKAFPDVTLRLVLSDRVLDPTRTT
jgi:hypothetical protein